MIDLCKIFGVEEGEEFRLSKSDIYNNNNYRIYNNKLHYYDYERWEKSHLDFNVVANMEVIKLPKKEFTDDELCILRNIDKLYKWIAKDKDNDYIYAYENKPYKKEEYWTGGINAGLYCFDKLFPTITWEDEEPVFIDDYVERGVE